jgi:nitrite reductase/ring-hydroxylating ferredoxin subunit
MEDISASAGTADEVRDKGCVVIPVAGTPVAVFAVNGDFRAVDNRCPHMGFPLSEGTVDDGVLTCHWHHARFDMASGCTFDLFADDVPVYPVEVRDGVVYVSPRPGRADAGRRNTRRLREGMEQNIALVIAKAVIALMRQPGGAATEIITEGALFGTRNRDMWGPGLTILSAMANILPRLDEEDRAIALYQGLLHVARDCAGQPPRRDRMPLETESLDPQTLRRWYRRFAKVRDRDGCERVLRTMLRAACPREVTAMMAAAVTDFAYLDTGHTLDFLNKALEATDGAGWEHADDILPALVRGLTSASRNEESNSWRHPVDLIALTDTAAEALPARLASARAADWSPPQGLVDTLLSDDSHAIVAALDAAFDAGAAPADAAKMVALAAALRIARFGVSNEYGDWISVLHSFTHANALQALLERAPDADVARGVYHAAMSVYLNRFLNVPPTRLPSQRPQPAAEPADVLLKDLTDLFDTQQPVDAAADLVHRYIAAGYPVEGLKRTLGALLLREDAEFHSFQCVEAGFRQADLWSGRPEEEIILVAVARYLAAHSPTERARRQTARIALRLSRGEPLHTEA